MTDKKIPASQPQRPGALRSDITVTLNTLYAYRLWQGRSGGGGAIPGMNHFLSRLVRMQAGSRADDPYADQMTYHLEEQIKSAESRMSALYQNMSHILEQCPRGLTVSEVNSTEPLKLPAFTLTPLGSRCFYLFLKYDEIAMYCLQAFGLGLIDEGTKARMLRDAGKIIRQIFTQVRDWNYRHDGITRKDVMAQTALAQEAARRWGPPDEDVFWGRHRSSFSPALNAQTVSVLQAMAASADIGAVPDDDPAGEPSDERGEQGEAILPPGQLATPEA
ncbi:hypothetical protein Z042_07570 [Chania multitudinisentens RB-25]|uniref:Conjugal transfer protein n=1 Tax=Chania multitudinisentens RB-25 TaxID=1441930 RepID=W0LL25_9GAMM|nr:TIGR03761 family integrating conjugative element protein [Chania multitudinisentens]AHG22705.1 hypothetical protein Z042_07570 [Chania multitudinisentens RB-25]